MSQEKTLISAPRLCNGLETWETGEKFTDIDLSLQGQAKDANDQIVRGNFKDLIKHTLMPKGKGKILNFLDITGSDNSDGFRTTELASDIWAEHIKIHKKSLARYSTPPTEVSNWHLVATAVATHPCHIDTAGYRTSISIKMGLKLVIIGVPAKHPSFEETNGQIRFGSLEHDMMNCSGLIPRAFLLGPGDTIVMRPCTLHYVATLENSICNGSHFYTASTMTDSLFGILHTFLHQNHATNQADMKHRVTLARLMCTWAEVLVGSNYFSDLDPMESGPWADVPDFTTMTGILNFLSLSNLMQFGSLLWSERYEDEEEDNALDALYNDGRTAAESILHWLDAAIVVKCGTVMLSQHS
ncbi:hypothetical protein PM082_006146 [Marasmius tenuissimus]|nr:hypothetical protein PM082_006146 [Marasmius tenuissimus]